MKKKHLCLVLTLIFALLLGGCASGETADKYVGDLITSIKKEDPSSLYSFLEQGISDENETYVLQFPDELKKLTMNVILCNLLLLHWILKQLQKTLAKNIVRPSLLQI